MKKYTLNFVKLMGVAAVALVTSCSNDTTSATPTMPAYVSTDGNTYTSDHAKNLNVVYFVPKGSQAVADYQKRLSGVLLALQDFYGKEMERNGYGYKTFGLRKDDATKRVQITFIQGNLTKENYTSPLVANLRSEVDAYFVAHPNEKSSDHYLILAPDNGIDNPFFGTGKYCYAKDLLALDMANAGQTEFVKWYGGIAHELGHALNLYHNSEKVSELPTLGHALMNDGNYYLTKSPVFLTAADCAFLNTNQIFDKGTEPHYGVVTSNITKISASVDATNTNIVVSGEFRSTIPVTGVTYYLDPNVNSEGVGVNKDYNATTWASKVIGSNAFSISIPIAELKYQATTPYEFKVRLVHANGMFSETIYPFNFVNGAAVIAFSSKTELPKTDWTVTSSSSQQTTSPAKNIIDGNIETAWNTQYSTFPAATFPHNLVIDLQSAKDVNGFTILNGSGYSVKDLEIQYSNDGTNFVSAGSYVLVASRSTQSFAFASKLNFRYLKVIAKTSLVSSSTAQIQEIGLY